MSSSAGDTLSLVGRTVAEKYLVEAVVGEGGIATVYRAMHLIWKRPVALKVFKALGDLSDAERKSLLDAFIQEGALLSELSARTAAIVQARDIGTLDAPGRGHVPYMVLEWLEGATLESVLEDEKARGLPPRAMVEAVRFLEPAAEALAIAHRKGVAHRDVKPGNIFVLGDPRADATVKILDFGIAKVISDAQRQAGALTTTSSALTSFTPAYGAPEQFSRSHGATGPWTDVFALALILLETLTGKPPLDGQDLVQLSVASQDPTGRPTPRAFGLQVSDETEAVFAKALAVKPTDRWQTAGEMWAALKKALHLEAAPGSRASPIGVTASDPTAQPAQAEPAPSRGPGVAIAVGAVVLVAAGLGAFALTRHPASPAAQAAQVSSTAPPAAFPSASASAATGPKPCPANMIAITGGSFFMGSDEGLAMEKPAHRVLLSPFCIDKYEVTTEGYKACSDEGRCKRAGTTNDYEGLTDKERKALDPLCNARDPQGRATHPINCVDWDMADKYCREQKKRLPTEAEWEFSARGPDGRKYPWGDEDPKAGLLNACGTECAAWGKKNGLEQKAMYESDDGFPNTAPVGSFPKGASRYGVEDVVGNVWEWVGDWYGPYGPDDEKDPKGPDKGEARVIRGGAWNGSYPSWVRPTFRYRNAPTARTHGIGFRCAADR
jgi:formylglycine-generating enzyme required for sulfatase activity/serine/threonine protein kinase